MLRSPVVWRREFIGLRRTPGWVLVYGRRKTGKTFMLRRLYGGGAFFLTVTRSLKAVVLGEGAPRVMGLEGALRKALSTLRGGGVVVVDEFQRLPADYWDLIGAYHPRGRLVLSASSLGIADRVFSGNSPILGLFIPYKVGVISLADTIVSLEPRLGPVRAVEWSIVVRDPWVIPYASSSMREASPAEFIALNTQKLWPVAKSLIGEVFEEEGRTLTRRYETILRLLGSGVWRTDRIAGELYHRGMVESYSQGAVSGLLDKLASIGLVRRIPLWKTRRAKTMYLHTSPILSIVYGLAENLGIDDYADTGYKEVVAEARRLYNIQAQFSLGELLAEHHGGKQSYTILPGGRGDIDIVVLDHRRKHILATYEVKTGKCTRKDLTKAQEHARDAGLPKPKIICINDPHAKTRIGSKETLTPQDLAHISKELIKRIPGKYRSKPI